MIPWLIIQAVGTIEHVLDSAMSMKFEQEEILSASIDTYIWFCILSLYQQFKRNLNLNPGLMNRRINHE